MLIANLTSSRITGRRTCGHFCWLQMKCKAVFRVLTYCLLRLLTLRINSNVKTQFLSLSIDKMSIDGKDHSSAFPATIICLFIICTCVSMCTFMWEAHILVAHVWRSEDNLGQSSNIFYLLFEIGSLTGLEMPPSVKTRLAGKELPEICQPISHLSLTGITSS